MRQITDPVSVLPGVGPKKEELLKRLGIETIYDLLCQFPFRYEDLSVKSVEELENNQKATLSGIVVTAPVVHYFRGRKGSRLHFRFKVQEAVINVNFFNQSYLKKQVQPDCQLVIYGVYDQIKQQLNGFKILNISADPKDQEELACVYHTTKGLSQTELKKWVSLALDSYGDLIPELLPVELTQHYHLLTHKEAIRGIHFPKDQEESSAARRQIKYQELFLYALRMRWRKYLRHRNLNGVQAHYDNQWLRACIQTIPFELTDGQKSVINQLCFDLLQPYPMNRLLQGDVGSGKTIIALVVLAAVVNAGYQGALMIPTEILADQHFQAASSFFEKLNIKVALLSGSTPAKEKRRILEGLSSGELPCVIGTHALFQEEVVFHKLGLVIIDEQHRFGVKQRQKLIDKNKEQVPNVLYMTATPIPRTLEITIMGDMEVSQLTEMPIGRRAIKTLWLKTDQMEQGDHLLREELKKGHQAYIICPLVGESEKIEAENAQAVYEDYHSRFKNQFQVGLLHGQLTGDEKEQVMKEFSENRVQILVATTVVEVGVNVPNATVMVILDADRFGLAQLHQLRGRVGRGSAPSYCLLMATPNSSNGKERMKIMTESTDGFYLSQKDLELRGAGDYFGTKQSGWPEFALADPIEDQSILEAARQDAERFVSYFKDHPKAYPLLLSWLEENIGKYQA